MQKWLDPWKRGNQMGFKLGRGTDDAHQVTRRIIEETARGKKEEGQLVMSMYDIDIEKAYPRACRLALWK